MNGTITVDAIVRCRREATGFACGDGVEVIEERTKVRVYYFEADGFVAMGLG
jgi:hypothetical protein